jgi:hypothetical protein
MDYQDAIKIIKILAMKTVAFNKSQKVQMIENLICGTDLEKLDKTLEDANTHGVNNKRFDELKNLYLNKNKEPISILENDESESNDSD